MDVEVRGDAVLVDGVALESLPGRPVPGGVEAAAPGGRVLVAAGPGRAPEAPPGARYAAVVLDLVFRPEQLGSLRRSGAVDADTRIVPLPGVLRAAELRRRTELWTSPPPGPHRTLLTGGVRSGKSAEAELRLAGEPDVTYVATGRGTADDPEWGARIRAHRDRRPAWWTTVETLDLATVLTAARGAVLVDGLGGWLTGTLDAAGAWDDPAAAWDTRVAPRVEELLAAWRDTSARIVAVSDEVGSSLVPMSASGRLYVDLLGSLNQRVAELSETVALVAAGRVLDLPVNRVPDGLRLALSLLTVVPVRVVPVDRATARVAMLAAPAVGLVVGGVAAAVLLVGDVVGLARPVAAVLAVGATAALTRALHLDGLADLADGLGSGRPPDGALAVMRRSDIGPFGVVTLVVALLVQVTALTAGPDPAVAVVVAAVAGRLALPWACRPSVPSARPGGLGALVAGAVGVRAAATATAVVLVAALAAGLATGRPVHTVLAVAAGLAAAALLLRRARTRLGGVTGDVLGALVETATTVALVVLSAT